MRDWDKNKNKNRCFEVDFRVGRNGVPNTTRTYKFGTRRETIEKDFEEWKEYILGEIGSYGGWSLSNDEIGGEIL